MCADSPDGGPAIDWSLKMFIHYELSGIMKSFTLCVCVAIKFAHTAKSCKISGQICYPGRGSLVGFRNLI